MKKEFYFLLSIVCTITIFSSSCTKNALHAKDEVKSTPLPGQDQYCRIESVWVKNGQFGQEYHLIGYDEYENPTFITTPIVTTGSPFRTFTYDSWHRLREYRESYSFGKFLSARQTQQKNEELFNHLRLIFTVVATERKIPEER